MRNLLIVGLIASILVGCKCPNQFEPCDEPPPLPVCFIPHKIRLALVLGGGGAKGMAHVGVLEEFEKAEIPIDLVVGCSAGSIVGVLYADDPCASRVKSILDPLRRDNLFDLNLWECQYGLSQGRSLCRTLRQNMNATDFHELKIPVLVTATDLYAGEMVTIGGGPIIPAVKASCAFPLAYVPVQLYGRVLVDGGVIDPVPVTIAKQMGAEIIVAVDLGSLLPPTFPNNMFGVARRCAEITLLWQSQGCLRGADVVIRPQLGHIGIFDEGYNDYVYRTGKEAAALMIPQIISCLREKGYIE